MSQKELPDFVALWRKYSGMSPGQKAQIGKRIKEPEELTEKPAFYRLFVGQKPPEWGKRAVFFFPFCTHKEHAKSIGIQFAESNINEKRVYQVYRSNSPNDLIYLRRLCIQIEPVVDWQDFGRDLFFWNCPERYSQKNLLEKYFIAQTR